ncbi:MAG: hypothetical protein K2X03_19400 [Bryobacteraceae bacterium]|nr:hypothetical protein [Bryobacteraceae bacterium]
MLHRSQVMAPRDRFAGQTVLMPYAHQAAILVDAKGTIREATSLAADLLGRTMDELRGTPFGVAPDRWRRVELDIVTREGVSLSIVARAETAVDEPGGVVVLLERKEQMARDLTIAQTGHLALADLGPRLAANLIAVSVAQWPEGRTIPAGRALLTDAISCLLDLTNPTASSLALVPALVDDDTSVEFALSLDLASLQEEPLPVDAFDRIELLMRRAHDVNGCFGLELADTGDASMMVKLVLPLV